MAEMMGGVLGAVTGLIGAGLQAQNQAQANIINWMNLQAQKENARKQFMLSTAARGDAYGNKQKYDEALNEWMIKLTPTQQQITKAGEREQLLSLTEDATRNRAIRQQQRARGIEAGKDYNKVLASWRYGGPATELSMRDELTNLLAGVTRENEYKKRGTMVRAAMREGRSGDTNAIRKAFADASGQSLAANMLQAKTEAGKEFAARTQAHQQQHLPVLAELQKLMDMGGDMPQRFSDTPATLAALQQQQFGGIQAALGAESSQLGSAYGKLAESMGKSPDLNNVAKALSGMGSNAAKVRAAEARQQGYGGQQQQPYYSLPQSNIEDDRWTNSYNEEFG